MEWTRGLGGEGMRDAVDRVEFPRTHFGRGCPRVCGMCCEVCCGFSPGFLSGQLEPCGVLKEPANTHKFSPGSQ